MMLRSCATIGAVKRLCCIIPPIFSIPKAKRCQLRTKYGFLSANRIVALLHLPLEPFYRIGMRIRPRARPNIAVQPTPLARSEPGLDLGRKQRSPIAIPSSTTAGQPARSPRPFHRLVAAPRSLLWWSPAHAWPPLDARQRRG